MRYVKQRDKYSCGPVAIMNVLKWAGYAFNYEDSLPVLQKLCKCISVTGTKHANFDRALRLVTSRFKVFKVRRVHRPKLWQIEEHLREGGLVILNYYWRKDEEGHRHFMLLDGVSDSGKSFSTINDFSKGPAYRRMTRRKFKRWNLRFQKHDPHYKAWFISLKD